MMDSSFEKPSEAARSVLNSVGHVFTMLCMNGSGAHSTREAVFLPARDSNAVRISSTDTVIPGSVTILFLPNEEAGIVEECTRFCTTF